MRAQLIIGILIELLLLGLIIGILCLGNRSLSRGYTIYVDFDRVENLKEGAEVRISALRVGRVLAIRQGITAGEPPLKARLRADLWIERGQGDFIRRNSIFYINSRGPIGERYVEVVPFEGEPWSAAAPGEVFRGIDAPRLDNLLQQAHFVVEALLELTHDIRPDLRELIQRSTNMRALWDQLVPAGQLTRLSQGVMRDVKAAMDLWGLLQESTLTRTSWTQLVGTVKHLSQEHRHDFKNLTPKIEALSHDYLELQRLLPTGQQLRLKQAFNKLRYSVQNVESMQNSIKQMAKFVQGGQGTVGRFLTDPTINDEIKETHRILKESPWLTLVRSGRGGPKTSPHRRVKIKANKYPSWP